MLNMLVTADGEVRFIYSDAARALLEEGDARIARASHVEPCGTKWVADMSPTGSPVKLGPFDTRQEALAAEVEWLAARLGSVAL